jgi:hypothetical protein
MHEAVTMPGNYAAVETTIQALEQADRLTDEHAAIRQAALSLADAVDAEPGNASLWREFRAVIETLRSIGATEEDDDEVTLILAALRGPAPVVNTEDAKPAKSGPRGGGTR